jgi:UV DNA damage repair endonuclease
MRLLELLDPGLENTDIQYNINIHVSNGSKNPVETADIVRGNLQTLNTVKGLPAYQGLLSFENEDRGCWTPETLLETFPDVPVVLDLHHHRCNPDPDTKDGIPQERTLQRIYDSWFSARGCAPLWHHSSAKTSPPETCRSHGNRMTVGDMETVYQLRRWFGAIELEVKDKDIALFEARKLLTKIDKKYAQT